MSDNPTKKIYISYAHAGKGKHVTESLDKAFQARNVLILRDEREVGYKESFGEYMKQLGAGDHVIVVIDKPYLESHNCMYELIEVYKNEHFRERIFPVVLSCAEIYKAVRRVDYIKHWEAKIAALNLAVNGVQSKANLQGIYEELNLYTEIRNTFATITDILADMNAKEFASHQADKYDTIFEAIHKEMNAPKKPKPPTIIKLPAKHKIYECNRGKQCTSFYGSRDTSKKVQPFFIHGDEKHGHEQLFERFCNELNYRNISEHTKFKIQKFNIDIPVIPDSSKFTEDLRIALFLEMMSNTPSESLPTHLGEAYDNCNTIKTFTKQDIVAVNFNISNPGPIHVIIEGITHLMDNICSASLLPPNAPKFYFFFSMKYDHEPERNFLIKKLFPNSEKKKIKQILDNNQRIPVIDELTWLKDDDIHKWLKSIKIQPEIRKEIIGSELFAPYKKSQGYYMRDLMSSFKKIIENYEKYVYAKS